jgi:nucleotide-binding universal stress UspA family protein
MSDIHEILVAVDFSGGSNSALDYAALIAKKLGANLHVIHVWQVPEFVPRSERTSEATLAYFRKALEDQASRELAELVRDAKRRGIAVTHAFTESGVPSSVIVDVAARQKYDLIVLGTHGRTGLAHALLGSVTEKVLRRAPCPVVAVRGSAPKGDAKIGRILAPVDYSEGSRRSLAFAADLARSCGAELDVVHVWDRPAYVPADTIVHAPGDTRRNLGELVRENAERQMRDFLAPFATARDGGALELPPNRLLSGEPASTLIAELEKGGHDLVVLGTHGRTGFRRLLLGSIAEKLVRYSPVAVVTVPPLPPSRAHP